MRIKFGSLVGLVKLNTIDGGDVHFPVKYCSKLKLFGQVLAASAGASLNTFGSSNDFSICSGSGSNCCGPFLELTLFSFFELNMLSASVIFCAFNRLSRLSILIMFSMFKTFRRCNKLSRHFPRQCSNFQSFGLVHSAEKTCVMLSAFTRRWK